jgi:hypothetical protein
MNLYSRLGILPLTVLVAGLASCTVLEEIKETVRIPGISRLSGKEEQKKVELPSVVAVMPFANETQEIDAAERMRKSFYNFFSSTPYVDVELADVDEGIVRLERSTGRNTATMKPQEICQAIGCDGLVFGKVTDYQKTFGGVYSRLRAEAEVWMVDGKTGKEVMRADSVDIWEAAPASPGGDRAPSPQRRTQIQETDAAELGKTLAKIPPPRALHR